MLADPAVYADARLGLSLHPKHAEILRTLFGRNNSRVSFRAGNSVGKALALSTPIPTPNGWTTMGQIKVGDVVIGGDGKPAIVEAVSDIMVGRDCYEVEFSDHSRIVADADHLWVTDYTEPIKNVPFDQCRRSVTITTDEMRRTLRHAIGNGASAHSIGTVVSELPEVALPIDPYVLGFWLGNGDSHGPVLTANKLDGYVADRCREAGYSASLKSDKRNGVLRILVGDRRGRFNTFKELLKAQGLLRNKHVPPAYLRASAAQRLRLLNGLMDSDGYGAKATCEFCSTEERLAVSVLELLCSLGLKPGFSEGRALLYGKDCGPKYRVLFSASQEDHIFTSPRKLSKLSVRPTRIGAWRSKNRTVVAVDYHPSVPVKCIRVSSPDNCYLAGNWIKTHNTSRLATAAILYALEMHGAAAISTAGSFRQVKQLGTNLKLLSSTFPQWDFKDVGIKIDGIDRYIGFAAKSEEVAQGYHKRDDMPLLAILDEAAGVGDPIFRAFEDRIKPTWLLIMGAPMNPAGMFYEVETKLSAFYDHFQMTQLECLVEQGYWLELDEVERIVNKWGRDNPFVQSSVYAEFAAEMEGAIVTLRELDACLNDPPEIKVYGRPHVWCDFAAGRAENVVAVCLGNRVWIEKAWTQRDTSAAVGEFVHVFEQLKERLGVRPNDIEGDADGLGVAFVNDLKEKGWPIQAFHGGAEPRFNEECKNLVAEAWLDGAQKMRRKEIIIEQNQYLPDLKAQLVSRKQRRNSSGKLELEPKEELAKRNVASPDRADAVMGAMLALARGITPQAIYVPKMPVYQSRF